MDGHQLWRATSLTVAASRSGTEIKDATGALIATCDPEGGVRDPSGNLLLRAPVHWKGHRNKPAHAEVEIVSADGATLGAGRVVKYGLGPRAKKATVAITDTGGEEVARLEPRDKKGEQLAVVSEAGVLATIDVAVVKSGFLKKTRVYTATIISAIPDPLRPLVTAAVIRYDGLLKALEAATMHQSMRD
jgi:hypothetical protein